MSNLYIFYFNINNSEERGSINMCRILNEIHGKTSKDIFNDYYESSNIPVDIVSIAKKIGIRLGSIDFTNLERNDVFKPLVETRGHILGAVFINGEDVQIVYNNHLDKNPDLDKLSDVDKAEKLIRRQRFTIAHEIAHCCLHMGKNDKSHIEYRTEQMDYTTPKERDANIFAGELLVPQVSIVNICDMFGEKINIDFLADLFRVSNNVMQARIDYLKKQGYFAGKEFIGRSAYN